MPCFASDVEVFLQVLTCDKKAKLLEKLEKSCESLTTVPKKVLGLSISVFKVRELIGDLFSLPAVGMDLFLKCICLLLFSYRHCHTWFEHFLPSCYVHVWKVLLQQLS